MYEHEVPGYLIVIILFLVLLCMAIFLAFLGYLPSPLSEKLSAHDQRTSTLERTTGLQCGVLMEMSQRDPLKCFDDTVHPREGFVGIRQ